MKKNGLGRAVGIIFALAAMFSCAACSVTEDDGDNNIQNKFDVAFSHSIVYGSKFESSLLGIGADLGEDWRFANDEELAISNGLEELTDKSLEEALQTKTFICDMMAEKKFEGGVDSITLTFPNMTAAGNADMSEREYAEATLVGLNSATAVIETVKLGSDEHVSIRLIGKTGGKDYYQRMIFVGKNGYMGMITFTCISEEDINEIISRFYIL